MLVCFVQSYCNGLATSYSIFHLQCELMHSAVHFEIAICQSDETLWGDNP